MTRSTPNATKYRDRWRSWNWNANHKWLAEDLASYLLEHRGLRHVSFEEMLDFVINGKDAIEKWGEHAIDRDEYTVRQSTRVSSFQNHHEIPEDDRCMWYMGPDRGDAFYQAFAHFGCSCIACGVVRHDVVTACSKYLPDGLRKRQRPRHESIRATGLSYPSPLLTLSHPPTDCSLKLIVEIFCPACLHSLFRAGWPVACDIATAAVRAALGVKVRRLPRRIHA